MFPSILFESNHLLAVNKPAGWITERSDYAPSVEAWAWEYLESKLKKPFLGIIHRLDRPVSGILLLAKKKIALKQLNEQFRERKVRKTYLAIVENRPPVRSETLEHWLLKDSKNKLARIRNQAGGKAQKVKLHYRLLQEVSGKCLLEVHPYTGKFHQIRAQLAAIGCPILGDQRYGGSNLERSNTIALHARRLAFHYPFLEEDHILEAPFPEDHLWKIFNCIV